MAISPTRCERSLAAPISCEQSPARSARKCGKTWACRASRSLSKRALGQLKSFGADFVVVGSYRDLGKAAGGEIQLIVELQDAGEGETIFTDTEKGTEAELDRLVARSASRLREKLGLGELSPERTRQLEWRRLRRLSGSFIIRV